MSDDMINGDSEEENKSSNDGGFDDDFGLPDLEFDELQELDMGGDDDDDSAPVEEAPAPSETPIADDPSMGSEAFDMSLLESVDEPGSGLAEDLEPPTGTMLDEGIDEVEDVLDSAQLISDRLGESEEGGSDAINYDDLLSSGDDSGSLDFGDAAPEEDSGSDLFADIDSPDDLAALGMAEESEVLSGTDTPSDSSSLFSADDGIGEGEGEEDAFATESFGEEDSDSIFGSDSLSTESEESLDFQPPASGDASLPPNYKSYAYEESKGGMSKVIIIGVAALFLAATGLLVYWQFLGGDDEKVTAKKEKVISSPKKKNTAKKEAPKETKAAGAEKSNKGGQSKAAAEKSTASSKPAVTKESKPKTSKPAAKTKKPEPKPKPEAVASVVDPGEIVRISERTSKSYVIIASFVDEDLAVDYANELTAAGKGIKIIEPYGKSKRYRLSIADYGSYGDAASNLDSYKGEFGDQVWALKY